MSLTLTTLEGDEAVLDKKQVEDLTSKMDSLNKKLVKNPEHSVKLWSSLENNKRVLLGRSFWGSMARKASNVAENPIISKIADAGGKLPIIGQIADAGSTGFRAGFSGLREATDLMPSSQSTPTASTRTGLQQLFFDTIKNGGDYRPHSATEPNPYNPATSAESYNNFEYDKKQIALLKPLYPHTPFDNNPYMDLTLQGDGGADYMTNSPAQVFEKLKAKMAVLARQGLAYPDSDDAPNPYPPQSQQWSNFETLKMGHKLNSIHARAMVATPATSTSMFSGDMPYILGGAGLLLLLLLKKGKK
jgi:hypothetical protein